MIRSMTGFGRAAGDAPGVRLRVGVRSVNHKGLKVALRAPDALHTVQAALEGLVRDFVERGALQLDIAYDAPAAKPAFRLHEERLFELAGAIERVRSRLGGTTAPLDLAAVARLPGVVEEVPPLVDDPMALFAEVAPVVREALGSLVASREREGEALRADLAAIGARLGAHVAKVSAGLPAALKSYDDRSRQRIEKLLAPLGVEADPAALARELAMFADKTDVSEELVRLRAHLEELARVLGGKGACGQRLEFLAQELQRETSTLGAKLQDPGLVATVLEMKVEVSRLKEQVANVE